MPPLGFFGFRWDQTANLEKAQKNYPEIFQIRFNFLLCLRAKGRLWRSGRSCGAEGGLVLLQVPEGSEGHVGAASEAACGRRGPCDRLLTPGLRDERKLSDVKPAAADYLPSPASN
jgi:hypothetical protein